MTTLCIFCGSRVGSRGVYAAAARRLGTALVARGMDMVYVGGHAGLMGVLADPVLAAGGGPTITIAGSVAAVPAGPDRAEMDGEDVNGKKETPRVARRSMANVLAFAIGRAGHTGALLLGFARPTDGRHRVSLGHSGG